MLKRLALVLVLLAALAGMAGPVFAASETKELFTLDRSYHMAVTIHFDRERPAVYFTAPDESMVDGAALRSDSGDGWVQYYLPSAAPGTWQITFDRLSNTQFEINYSSYMDSLSIAGFTLGTVQGDSLPVSFQVASDASASYQYGLYAVITDSSGAIVGERLLAEGQANLNEAINREVSVRELSDYGSYQLRLDVWRRDGVEEAFDSKIADGTFAAAGHSTGTLSPDFLTEIHLADGDIRFDLGETRGAGEYLIGVFDEAVSAAEPFFFTELADGAATAEAMFAPDAAALRVELTHSSNGRNALTRVKQVPIMDTGVSIQAEAGEFTNSSQARIRYDTDRPIMAEVRVNEKYDTVNLDGTGNFSVELLEAYNEVEIRYSIDDPYVVYVVRFQVAVDSVPPLLRLPENKSAIRIGASEYILAGITEPGAMVKVSDVEIVVNGDGTFIHDMVLDEGENIVRVTATDAAGNVAAQDVVIYGNAAIPALNQGPGNMGAAKGYIPMMLSFLASIVFLALTVGFARGFRRSAHRLQYVFTALRNMSIGSGVAALGGLGFCFWNYATLRERTAGEDYFALAQRSIDEAYGAIQEISFYERMMAYLGIGVGSCILAGAVLHLAARFLKRAKNAGKRQAPLQAGQQTVWGAEQQTAWGTEQQTARGAGQQTARGAGQQTARGAEQQTGQGAEQQTAQGTVAGTGMGAEAAVGVGHSCPNCGTEYREPVKFCGKCGTPM